MYVILVYDTAAERNPRVLETCRQYLHWVQRSVFQGQLSTAQHRNLTTALHRLIDPSHDSIRIYRAPGPDLIESNSSDPSSAPRTPSSDPPTCDDALPPERCRSTSQRTTRYNPDLHLYTRVASSPLEGSQLQPQHVTPGTHESRHHPWRDRNATELATRAGDALVASHPSHPWRDRNPSSAMHTSTRTVASSPLEPPWSDRNSAKDWLESDF